MLRGGFGTSGVINSRLDKVITPSGLIFVRSSSSSHVYVDYYFYVGVMLIDEGWFVFFRKSIIPGT